MQKGIIFLVSHGYIIECGVAEIAVIKYIFIRIQIGYYAAVEVGGVCNCGICKVIDVCGMRQLLIKGILFYSIDNTEGSARLRHAAIPLPVGHYGIQRVGLFLPVKPGYEQGRVIANIITCEYPFRHHIPHIVAFMLRKRGKMKA